MRRFYLFVCAFCLILSSCAKANYSALLSKETRKSSVYDVNTLSAKLILGATYLSDEFKEYARNRLYKNDIHVLGPEYLEEGGDGFIVYAYLEKGTPPISDSRFWSITLNKDGTEYLPESIKEIDPTPREEILFPYINRWGRLYWIRFSHPNLSRPFSLEVKSAAASSRLVWR
jgi:hypothetical protein